MCKQLGRRPTNTEASMHIGSFVQKKNSKSMLSASSQTVQPIAGMLEGYCGPEGRIEEHP